MAKKLLIVVVLAGLIAGAYFYFKPKAPESGAPGQMAAAGGPGGGGMPVEAQKVGTGSFARSVEAVGTLISNESVVLSPETAGRVTEILFTEGQEVAKGDTLIRLDDAIARAELAEAEASHKLSSANYKRAEELLSRQTGTVRARDEALASLNTNKARLDLARVRVDKTSIKAPFDGVVGLRKVSVGDYVNPGQELVNLESIDPLKVDFSIAETYLNLLKPGQKIEVTLDAFPSETFSGEVFAIDPKIDSAGRSILMRAQLPNPDGRLRPGLFARVRLMVEQSQETVMIPEQALMPQGTDQFVYKVVDGKAEMTKVVTGDRREGQVVVQSGLVAGDTIITAGQMKIGPGMPVMVMPAGGPPEPAAGDAPAPAGAH